MPTDNDYDSAFGSDASFVQKEKAKARQIRKTRWWQQKIASGRCYYCGQIFSPSELTMDHVVPLARGGRSTRSNLVPACKLCNTNKESQHPMDWFSANEE